MSHPKHDLEYISFAIPDQPSIAIVLQNKRTRRSSIQTDRSTVDELNR